MPISKDRSIFQLPLSPIRSPAPRASRPLCGKDLSFPKQETQHSTHALHAYVSAINPPLARELITNYAPPKGTVLDPFCGGGGVIVESILATRKCSGGEINPLAVIISQAKTTYLSSNEIRQTYECIRKDAQRLLGKATYEPSKSTLYWFKPYLLAPLAALKAAIERVESEELRTLFKVVFSAAIRDVMLTYRGEVRLRRLTGRDYERFNPDAFVAFNKRAELAIERVGALPKGCHANIGIRDAKAMPFDSSFFDAIICSPPYADDKNGVSYFQFSKNMLEWLGYSKEEIRQYKSKHLGGMLDDKQTPPSPTLNSCLEHVKEKSHQHYREAVAFYADYYASLREMSRVSKEYVIIVIGNRVLSRTVFDNGHITLELMKNIGIELQDYYQRALVRKRIPNLGYDGGGIATEHILIFRK